MAATTAPGRWSPPISRGFRVRLLINERNMGFGGRTAAASMRPRSTTSSWSTATTPGATTRCVSFSATSARPTSSSDTRGTCGAARLERTLISKVVHVSRQPHYPALADVLQRPADPSRAGPQEPADRVARVRLPGRGAGQGAALHADHREVPWTSPSASSGESKAFRLKNFIDVARTLAALRAAVGSRRGAGGPVRAAGR